MLYFYQHFGVKIDVKNERKRVSRMCENAYLSIKNPKASRALRRALDPGRRLLALLARLCFAMSATFGLRSWGPPLDQILDPHLAGMCVLFLRVWKPVYQSRKLKYRKTNKITYFLNQTFSILLGSSSGIYMIDRAKGFHWSALSMWTNHLAASGGPGE